MADLHEHVLPQLVYLLDAIALDSLNQVSVHILLVRDLILPLLQALLLHGLVCIEFLQISRLCLQLSDSLPLLGESRFVLITKSILLIIYCIE